MAATTKTNPLGRADRAPVDRVPVDRVPVDVVIVGGGPAGAAAALQLARAGHTVIVIDDAPKNDAAASETQPAVLLPPRALTELERLAVALGPDGHRVDHVTMAHAATKRCAAAESTVAWPTDPNSPTGINYAMVVPRPIFHTALLDAARAAGATVLRGFTAVNPLVERGFVRGARVVEVDRDASLDGPSFDVRGTFTMIADGANSRFGRSLGTFRQPDWPYAIVHAGRYRCRRSTGREIGILLGLHDRAGTPLTGHAWMWPSGDGTVTVSLMVMSTSPSFQVINPDRLLAAVVDTQADRWQLDPEPLAPPVGGRLPLGLSVGPAAGPTYLVAGDAAGAANPITGLGTDMALETARIAAETLADALVDGAAALQQYPARLDATYGEYFKSGRVASRVLSHPLVSQRLAHLLASRRWATKTAVRIGVNHLRPGRVGRAHLAETLVRAARTINPIAPSS